MPLYLVRWPTLSFTIVDAPDEQQLKLILAEHGDPGGCKYWVYRGPLVLDFDLDVDYAIRGTRSAMLRCRPEIDDASRIRNCAFIKAGDEIGCGDTSAEMMDTIMRQAFPHLTKYYDDANAAALELCDRASRADPETCYDPQKLNEALHAELELVERHKWRSFEDDPDEPGATGTE